MGSKIAQGLHPDHKGDLTDRRSIQGLMSADARPSTRPIRRNVEKLSDIWEDFGLQYGKGQTVLGMVEQWVGPEIFRRGINDYINEHAWGNAHAADLWAALSKASGQDISGPLSGFLDQTGLPLVQASIEPGGVVKISQQRFLNHGVQAGQQNWTFPVRLKVAAGGKVETRTVIMDGAASTVEFNGEVDWLLPDAGAYGYYRWEVPQPLMARLAREAGENLSAAERIAFLGNAAALLDHGTMSGGDYLEILNAFADDPEPEVVSTMISGLGKVEGAFVSDDLKDEFAVYLRATLRPILDRFGFDRKPGEDEAISLFRPRLIGWLGFSARDPEVQARAAQLARTYMKKPESMDPSLAGTVLAVAARSGDQALYDAFRKKFETTTSPTDRGRYLGALGSFTDEKIRQQALAYSLDGPLRANEIFTIPGAISGESEADQDRILQWVMSHYKDLSGRIPAQFHPRLTSFAGGCSAARLESGRAFFMDPAQRVDGTENALKKVTERVHDCLSLRQREGAAVMAYLEAAPAAQAASRSGTAPH